LHVAVCDLSMDVRCLKRTPTLRRRFHGVNACDARVLRTESAPGTNVSTTNTPPFPCRAEQLLSEIEPLVCFHELLLDVPEGPFQYFHALDNIG
jgi:hypothetical protein